jgi:hypothetical protein
MPRRGGDLRKKVKKPHFARREWFSPMHFQDSNTVLWVFISKRLMLHFNTVDGEMKYWIYLIYSANEMYENYSI